MSFLTTSRQLSTTRMVISTCCCIPHRTLILAFSGKVFISSSVLFHSVGKPVCSFITSSASRFRALRVHWGSSVTIHWLLAHRSDFYGSTSDDSGSIFPAGPGSSLCDVLLAHWGGLFYWSWQVTVHSFDLGVFSRFCVWLGASSFSHPPRKKNQVCHISLKTLQCYSGKVISLSLAILGCKLYVPEVFKSTSCHSGSSQGRNSSLETQGQSVGLGEKAGRKFSSTDKRAPGYQLSPNYFQEFRQMPAPDWSQKMLCTIVPNWQTVSPEFFLWVRRWWLLSRQTYPVRSPSLCMQGELLFSTLLTRNERTTNKSKKRLGCYQQEQFNLPRE